MGESTGAHELVMLDQAGQELAEARTLDAIKTIRDKAEAVRQYAQNASLGLDVQNRAAEVKLRAERQAGKLLSQLMLRGGDRRSKSHHSRLKLNDLGLTPNQSKRWQLQARIPEDIFRAHVTSICNEGKELTSAGLMRLAKRLREEETEHGEAMNGGNGHADKSHHANGNAPVGNRLGKCAENYSTNAHGDIVGELLNHHRLLNGILQQLYGDNIEALRPAELRMIRYLMSETAILLGKLS